MSPGVTFERVYRELKRQLAEGRLRPGAPIEPAVIGAELGASVTPIRDALHRLVGERLVAAPRHNGFRVPQLTEAQLRDLYTWNSRVLGLAVSRMDFDALELADASQQDTEDFASAISGQFLRIARATGSDELIFAASQLDDRLAPYRRVELQALDYVREEHDAMSGLLETANRAGLRSALARYHRRRTAAAPRLLALL